ncbi:MAG: glyoxalase/bleomycin resistance protein/dioxygenase [Frondihabitans sp.]|nr:glyoxalase/bleomycin resistance protein/dioxygenase [Frondihabitans sp.]
MNGDICWVDLGVRDVDACASFYTALFGWAVAAPDDEGYRLASVHDHLVAALGPAELPGLPYWTVYAETNDVVRSVHAALAAGGTLLQAPQAAGDFGTAAVIADPTGAPLSLWQPDSHLGTWTGNEPGTLAGVELRTDDAGSKAPFLHSILGWEQDGNHFHLDGRVVAKVVPDNTSLSARAGSPWLVRFRASGDSAEQVEAAIKAGATVVDADSLVFADPSGSHFALGPTHTENA